MDQRLFAKFSVEKKPMMNYFDKENNEKEKEISNQKMFHSPMILSEKTRKKLEKISPLISNSPEFNQKINVHNFQKYLGKNNILLSSNSDFMYSMVSRFNEIYKKKKHRRIKPLLNTKFKEFRLSKSKSTLSYMNSDSTSITSVLTPKKESDKKYLGHLDYFKNPLNDKLFYVINKMDERKEETLEIGKQIRKMRYNYSQENLLLDSSSNRIYGTNISLPSIDPSKLYLPKSDNKSFKIKIQKIKIRNK